MCNGMEDSHTSLELRMVSGKEQCLLLFSLGSIWTGWSSCWGSPSLAVRLVPYTMVSWFMLMTSSYCVQADLAFKPWLISVRSLPVQYKLQSRKIQDQVHPFLQKENWACQDFPEWRLSSMGGVSKTCGEHLGEGQLIQQGYQNKKRKFHWKNPQYPARSPLCQSSCKDENDKHLHHKFLWVSPVESSWW